MNYFHQFDISDFFNEIKEPIFLIDSEEVIFWNIYAKENYLGLPDNWRTWFSKQDLLEEIQEFFSGGAVPKKPFYKSLQDKNGDSQRFEWTFVNLPSSYNSRFLIIKGNKIDLYGRLQQEGEEQFREKKTKEELQYIQSILNNSHDLIAILDRLGNYKFISESVAEKLGFPVEEIVGKSYQEFEEKGAIEMVRGTFQDVLNTNEVVNIDFWVHLSNGKKIYLESFARNLLHHPEIQGILFSSRDITDYIEKDRSLQKRYEIENLINQISSQLLNGGFKDLEKDFQEFLIRFGAFFKAKTAVIYILNRDTEEFEILNIWNPDRNEIGGHSDRISLIFSRKNRLEAGIVKLVESDDPEDRFLYLLVPMLSTSKLRGVIYFEIEREDIEFEEKELQVFRQLGDILAGAYIGSLMTRKIERNENLLATTESLSKSGSWRYSTSQNRFYVSGGFARLFGIGDQPLSTDFSSLIYQIEKPYREDFVRNLKKSIDSVCVTSGEFTIKNEQGKTLFISYEIDAKHDFLTQGLEVTGFCKDISLKREAEENLRLQSQILAQVSDPILVTGLDLRVIYLNEAALELCCPGASQPFKGNLEKLVNWDWRESLSLEELAGSLELGQIWQKEIFLQTQKSPFLPFLVSIKAIQSEKEEKIGYSFILRSLAEKYESEQMALRARMIIENSPVVLFQVDPNDSYRILYISENIDRYGYHSKELIEKKASILDLIHPDDWVRILENQPSLNNPNDRLSFSGEYRIRKTDGTYSWVEDRTSDVTNEIGEIVLHEGLFQDISERKVFEEYKEEKEKQYRVLASNIPGTNIFLLDEHRRYILAEGTHFDFWEKSPDDFEGKFLHESFLTNLDVLNEQFDQVYFEQKIVESEFFYKDRYYQRVIRPVVEHGRVTYALTIIRDITSEYVAKEKLKSSEEKYRALVEESTEVIFSLSDNLRFNYLSPNINQYLGYEVEEVVGKSVFEFLNPEDLEVFNTNLKEFPDFLEENQQLEYRLRHKNGEYRVFNSNGRIVRDKEEGRWHYTGIARDISRLKEAQKELVQAKEKAEQASLVKSQFLSVMSHEIRTPMNAVIGLAHFLMEENPRPDQLENLRTLQFSAENLMTLINDILDFNKIESGKLELEAVPFDIRNLLHRIVHSHSFQAHEKSLDVSFEIDESIPELLIGDSVRIGQIIHNLVSNAIKFTEKGYVKIQLKEEGKSDVESLIRFRFIDTGIGIPEDKVINIFDAFTQATSATTRKYGGTGLGLAIVKRLVELYKGEIFYKTNPEGGSIFEFVIPFNYKLEKGEEGHEDQQNQPKSLRTASILVAEDNMVNQILVKKFLKKWESGNLVMASNGQEALELFEEGDFNIVLLDLQMPIMDGFSVAKAIRLHENLEKRKVPILALTATSIHEIKEQLDEIGFDDYIPKPFTPEGLYERLNKYLHPKN
ncbi:PAS domain S-box protein [Algoriphagus sp. CAU 1675]|uniref:PAS domain S-box protein n=1 Tax=Algoriphagus sp. CAU 1675 TaxID=3032597 RepID=UPI0023DC8E53|nr:PAS domain S-box protein [Algoriphagus sp. CAU 1675]MDF2158253.1 PAS domain S-box protein [Algoriphagus sp. CAU 1675]